MGSETPSECIEGYDDDNDDEEQKTGILQKKA